MLVSKFYVRNVGPKIYSDLPNENQTILDKSFSVRKKQKVPILEYIYCIHNINRLEGLDLVECFNATKQQQKST